VTSDVDFVESLRVYLWQYSEGNIGSLSTYDPAIPLFKREDGSIDRAKTLALPCFANMKISEDNSYA